MATEQKTKDFISNRIQNILDSYKYIDISLTNYLKRVILPSLIFVTLLFGIGFTINNQIATVLILFTSGFILFLVSIYPIVKHTRDVNEINSKFHLFVTQLTILSLSNSDRVEVFRIIANEDDYGALAKEIKVLVSLIDAFNLSLDDAARRRSQHTKSELLADFYEKLSYSVGEGQSLSEFLLSEQEDVRDQFSSKYNSKVKNIEMMTELFISVIMASSFLFTFAILVPFLTGVDAQLLMTAVLFIFVVTQLLFIVIINSIAPKDEFWYDSKGITTRKTYLIKGTTVIGLIASVSLTVGLFLIQPPVELYFYPIIAVLPLMIPTLGIIYSERSIKKVEQQYPSFIRSLGSVESVKQTSTVDVLKSLKEKEFKTLNRYIETLYRRLQLSVDNQESWNLFSAQIGSNIIKVFSDMYVYGRETGGSPKQLGEIISRNYRFILQLRENRQTINQKLMGTMYGITIATSSVFFIALEILQVLIEVTEDIPSNVLVGDILNTAVYNYAYIELVVFVAILFNALAVSTIIRISQRKFIGGVVIHFMFIVLLSFSIGYGINYVATEVLTL